MGLYKEEKEKACWPLREECPGTLAKPLPHTAGLPSLACCTQGPWEPHLMDYPELRVIPKSMVTGSRNKRELEIGE